MTDQTSISPKSFKLSFSLCMVKDDWPSRYDRPDQDTHLKVLSSDLVCTWWKMIDPPGMTEPDQVLT